MKIPVIIKPVSIVLLLATALLVACGHKTSTLTYKMKNLASDSVIITRSVYGNPGVSDTSWVGYNQEVTVAVIAEGAEHISTYKETGKLRSFIKLNVYKIHFAGTSKTDFLNAGLWTYNEHSKHAADYTTDITDKDF